MISFTALVNIIASLVSQRQFTRYRHIMDEYIRNHFSSINACTEILKFLTVCLDEMHTTKDDGKIDGKKNKLLREAMKVIHS